MTKLKAFGKAVDKFFKYFGYYLAIAGLVTFSLFIHEEAFQTTMFGTWPAQDAREWQLVKKDIAVMEFINDRMKWMNKWFGWVQPLGWMAYDSYGISADQYIKGVKAKTFAYCPECFDGEEVEFTFTATELDAPVEKNGHVYFAWKVHTLRILTMEALEGGETYVVRGLLENGRVYVTTVDRRSGNAKPKQDPGPSHQRREESAAALR